MGKISDPTFKNIFITPDEGDGTLQVFIGGKQLNRQLFELKANRSFIQDISIYAGILSKEDFIHIIENIKASTSKMTCIAFTPLGLDKLDESLSPEDLALKRNDLFNEYVQAYREESIKKDKDNGKLRHFPDNIVINNAITKMDLEKDNYIKKGFHI